jgi:hypothetical protein
MLVEMEEIREAYLLKIVAGFRLLAKMSPFRSLVHDMIKRKHKSVVTILFI